MSKLKRLLALSSLAGLLGALAFALPAKAATFKAVCVFNGDAKAGTINKPGSIAAPYVRLIGGKGTFSFASMSLRCLGLD